MPIVTEPHTHTRPSSIHVKMGEANVGSPLKSPTSFQSGRNFWMKFAEEKKARNSAPSDEETLTSRPSYLARDIRAAGSNVSSLTGDSGFRRRSRINIDTKAQSSSRRSLSTVSPLSTPHSFASSKDESDIKVEPMHNNYRSKSKEMLSSGRKTPKESRQSFIEAKMAESYVSPRNSDGGFAMNAKGGFGFGSQTKATKEGTSNSKHVNAAPPSPSLSKTSHKTTQSETFKQAYSVWQKAGLMEGETDKPQPVPAWKIALQKRKKEKEAKLETLQTRMQNFRDGVMKDASNGQETESAKVSSRKTERQYPSKVWKRPESIKIEKETVSPSLPADTASLTTYSSHQQEVEISPKSSNDAGFQNILQRWQSFSDDVSKPHSLSSHLSLGTSPTASMASSLYMSETKGVVPENTGYKNRTSVERLEVRQRVDDFGKLDFFDQMRVKESPRESQLTTSPAPKTKLQVNKSMRKTSSLGTKPPKKADAENSISQHVQRLVENLKASTKTNKAKSKKRKAPPKFETGNRAIVLLETNGAYELFVGQTQSTTSHKKMVLQNVELISREEEASKSSQNLPTCECSRSLFSGNDDLINFFLPQMGMACNCGKQKWGFANQDDPIAIENVLRPWQVKFLQRFGIQYADQLVKARHRSAGILAKAMRQWRQKEGMIPFKTSSCMMAIDIWAKTCTAYLRSLGKENDRGNKNLTESLPDALVSDLSMFLNGTPNALKSNVGMNHLQYRIAI